MKLAKMSLAAVLVMGASAFAIDNVKVNGATKLIYQTTASDAPETSGAAIGTKPGLFDKGNSRAQVSATLGASANLTDSISGGAEVQALSTLGLQGQLVSKVMNDSNGVKDSWNVSQLWIAASLGNTTAKIGRQELNTPFAFTEKWNVVKNTFEAAVLLNSDIPNTTLVGAYVGGSNGMVNDTANAAGTGWNVANMGQDGRTGFNQFFGGAYAAGVVNTSVEATTLQAWYYAVNAGAIKGFTDVGVNAFWLQADTKLIPMVTVGAQFANMDPDGSQQADAKSMDAWALKVAGDISMVSLFAAYSSVGKSDTVLTVSNTATQDKTKLYTGTASIYMDGAVVGQQGTDSWKVGVKAKLTDVTLGANYTAAELKKNDYRLAKLDVNAWDVNAATKVGPLALKAIYTQFDTGASSNSKRDTLRIIAGIKF
jgi:hypothetical protein